MSTAREDAQADAEHDDDTDNSEKAEAAEESSSSRRYSSKNDMRDTGIEAK